METVYQLIVWASLAVASPEDLCHAHFYWGHGEDVGKLKKKEYFLSPGSVNIAQGCYLENINWDIPGSPAMYGFNGDWMPEPEPNSNAGMDPIPDFSQDHYMTREKRQVASSVGFMRLSKTNWWALLRKMEERISDGTCKDGVKVDFLCPSPGLQTDAWEKRLKRSKDKYNLKTAAGEKISFENNQCDVKDENGAELAYVPQKCGDSFKLSAKTFQKLREPKSWCSYLLNK